MTRARIRPTWAEIDLDAITHNIKAMHERLPKKTKIVAVVKANGYGHGSIQVAKKALDSGATSLAVALLEEALELREAGINAPILVMGWVPPEAAPIAAKHHITLTFFQKDWLDQVSRMEFDERLQLHLKLDTGMGRIGIRSSEALREILYALNDKPSIYLTGVYTHFATADGTNLTYFHKQKEQFERMLSELKEQWSGEVTVHIGNSASAIRLPGDMYDFVRYGISMYGLYPSQPVKEEQAINLKQAFSLHSRLAHVKQIEAGDAISYGLTYKAEKAEWIGTIPIGYGDGWIRKLQGFSVLVDGKRMPIVGRICMDQTMVRLDQEYPVGTKVTLLGSQNGSFINIDEAAAYVDTISYEIPCLLNERIPRIYKGG
ncbi:alanine racemase [Oceanobacillus picturae]|uniref:Alanine racemase n=1 Tax=Oceanobacillus picturae TaxID=171693 RepID=W9AEI1_9BACI|nr:alanine racemase [Oceanobacillus picturae]GAQ17773.1 alanine racemase [Oceanobacillus picturae]CDO04119.1 Alanine racemase [Oceanobacillus picturae]